MKTNVKNKSNDLALKFFWCCFRFWSWFWKILCTPGTGKAIISGICCVS